MLRQCILLGTMATTSSFDSFLHSDGRFLSPTFLVLVFPLILCPCFKKLTLVYFGAALAIQDRDKVIPASTEQLGYKPPKYYGIGHSTKKGELWA